MKYLIISDIHGSSKYLKMVLDKHQDFDKLIILGDILYHGPRNNLPEGYNPKEVIEILNGLSEKIIAVRGNCDAKVDLMVLKFAIEDGRWIKIDKHRVFLTHGDEFNSDRVPTKMFKYVMLYGHFHKNVITKISDKITSINIGSLAIPKDNHFSYAIIEDNKLTSYDLIDDSEILNYKF
jgi:hypothetical protein